MSDPTPPAESIRDWPPSVLEAAHANLGQAHRARERLQLQLGKPGWLRRIEVTVLATGDAALRIVVESLSDAVFAAVPIVLDGVIVIVSAER